MNFLSAEELEKEAVTLNQLLVGKLVRCVYRHREGEVCIEFEGGARLFVDIKDKKELELSFTEG